MESSVVSAARNPLQLDFARKRGFALGLVMIAAFAIPVGAQAQVGKAKEPPTFELSAGSIGISDLPPLYRLEEAADNPGKRGQKWVPFEVPNGSRGVPVRMPLKAPVQLYTGTPDTPEGAKMEPFLQVPVKKEGERLFLLFHLDEKGNMKHLFLEDADGSHAAGAVRVVNLTGQRMAFSVGGQPVPVLGGGQQVATPVMRQDGRFPFKHFEERAGGVAYESPLLYLRLPREDMRLTVIFAPMPVEPESDEQGRPRGPVQFVGKAMQLYDRQPGYVAGTAARPKLPAAPVLSAPAPAGSAPTPALRECAIGVMALGSKWAGRELELGIAGQSGTARAGLLPGTLVPLKVPVTGETRVSLRTGDAALGAVTLGTSMTNALLALAPPAQPGDPPSYALFEMSEQSHPRGKVRIFNLTPYQLAYTSGTKPVYVNPQGSALVDDVAPGAEVPLKLALEVGGKWVMIDQTARKSPPNDRRSGLFIFPSENGAGEFTVMEKPL